MWWGLLVLAILAISPHPANAQADLLLSDAEKNAPSVGNTSTADPGYTAFRMEEERSRRYSVAGLLLAMILSQILVLLFLVRSHQCTATAVVHGSGLVLVVYATVMIVILARADQQLTAAIGILGAIAGYLFGSATREAGQGSARQQQPPAG